MLKSVDRAVQLLQLLSEQELGTTEAAQALQTDKAAVVRLTQTLSRSGVLTRDPVTRRFRIGPELGRIALRYLRSLNIADVLLPYMRQLQSSTGESISLAIRKGPTALCVAKVDSHHPLRIFSDVGNEFPLHCGSSGKALLAGLPERELAEFLARSPLTRYTEHTITDPDPLCAELRRISAQGFAVSREELNEGVLSIGIPLQDADGYPVASVTVVGPIARMEREYDAIIGQLGRFRAALAANQEVQVAVNRLRFMPLRGTRPGR